MGQSREGTGHSDHVALTALLLTLLEVVNELEVGVREEDLLADGASDVTRRWLLLVLRGPLGREDGEADRPQHLGRLLRVGGELPLWGGGGLDDGEVDVGGERLPPPSEPEGNGLRV